MRQGLIGLAVAAAVAAALPRPAAAQDEGGGPRLSFGLALGVDTASNPGLKVPAEDRATGAYARLSFTLSDMTRLAGLSLTGSGILRADAGGDEDGIYLEAPALRLSWNRESADARLTATGFWREDDLDTLRGLTLDPETGELIEGATGEGTRRQTGGDLGYEWGRGGPWGFTLGAGLTDTTYHGATTEPDRRSLRASAGLRFALNPATDLNLGLRRSRYEEDGRPARDTTRLEAGVSRALPDGSLGLTLYAEDTEDGTRSGLSLGRVWDLPDGRLSASLGLTRTIAGRTGVTGSLDYARDLPNGRLTAGLARSIAAGSGDAETEVTRLNLGLMQEIGPRTAVNFGLTAAESTATATGLSTRTATASATLSHALPQDWSLDAGLRHRLRDEDGVGRATSDTLFLELRRTWDWPL